MVHMYLKNQKELEKLKSDSTDLLNDTIQKSNSKIKTILSKHGDEIKQLKEENNSNVTISNE